MFDTPGESEGLGTTSINKNKEGTSGNTRHNELSELRGKVKQVEGIMDKEPFQPIKYLFKVNLKDHVVLQDLHFPKVKTYS